MKLRAMLEKPRSAQLRNRTSMSLKLRPTGLGSGIDKDRPD
jgi:hypothetical protein